MQKHSLSTLYSNICSCISQISVCRLLLCIQHTTALHPGKQTHFPTSTKTPSSLSGYWTFSLTGLRVNNTFSDLLHTLTAYPQACVLWLFTMLFILNTNDCRSTQPKWVCLHDIWEIPNTAVLQIRSENWNAFKHCSPNMIGVGELWLSEPEKSDCHSNLSAMYTPFSDCDSRMRVRDTAVLQVCAPGKKTLKTPVPLTCGTSMSLCFTKETTENIFFFSVHKKSF